MMARVWREPSEDFRRCAYQAMQQRIVTFFVHNGVIEQAILAGDVAQEKKYLLEKRLIGVALKDWRTVVVQ